MLVSEPPASEVFDDFRLIRPLGQGGMGAVWLGHDTLLDRPVALKFLTNPEEGTQGRTRLLAEARALARVHHPNVAAVYRIGEVDGKPYIASEYIDGVSLAHTPQPRPWRSALEIGLGLARGLAAVHRQGVLHCDIKPANIVLTRAGEPKLIDFGIARVRRVRDLAGALVAGGRAEPSATDAVFAGTPLYMAPELWQGHSFSEQTDIYALGLVLYELLAGPFTHRSVAGDDLIAYLATREIPHLNGVVEGLPAALGDLVARLTATGASERFASVDAVVDGLEVIRSLYRNFTEREDTVDDDRARLLAHLESLVDRRAEIGRHFYDSLFATHPEVRPLFPDDMAGQQRKLEGALELVVRRLGDQETLVPLLEDLGRRHADYGVSPAHFEAVGHQLLATLETLSGPTWNDELRRAWAYAYDRIAHVMVRGLESATADITASHDLVPPTLWNLPVGPPVTQHAHNGQISIAYQVIGSGPLDLLVVPELVSHLELAWEQPQLAAFLRRLSSFARLILIDRRGSGLSDRAPGALSLDEQLGDLDAVLDAVEADRAALLCFGTGGALGAAYAAMRPDRTRALVLYGAAPRVLAAPDFPQGITDGQLAAQLAAITGRWGDPQGLEALAPSLAGDPELRDWWSRYLRAGANPGSAAALHALNAALDLRPLLPAIHAPTLVLHRTDDRVAPIAGARLIAAQIRAAEFQALAGADHLPFLGDAEAIVAAIHHFLAATPEPAAAPRLVTTVALAVHDPSCVPTVRALFSRALASAGAHTIDRETLTAELAGTSSITVTARTLLATTKLLGLPVSAAVITDIQPRHEGLAHQIPALELAHATAPGKLGLNPLARELGRGSRAVIGEDEPPV